MWSIVSLVTALLGLTLVGVVCAVVGLARTAGGRRRGRGLAVAGLVVSVLVLLGQVALVVTLGPELVAGAREGYRAGAAAVEEPADEPADQTGQDVAGADAVGGDVAAGDQAEEADPAEAEVVGVDDLEAGDCFDDPESKSFYEITVLPCDVPHDGEVATRVTLEGDRYPGATAVDDLAWDTCTAELADLFDAQGIDSAGLDFWTFTPTKESWVLYEDREVDCLVYGIDGPLDAPIMPPTTP